MKRIATTTKSLKEYDWTELENKVNDEYLIEIDKRIDDANQRRSLLEKLQD